MSTAEKPLIVPLFIPHVGCPHQCVFCNQKTITGREERPLDGAAMEAAVDEYLGYAKKSGREVQLAFYGGTFLGLPESIAFPLLREAKRLVAEKKITGIRFSTRPDTITEETLDRLSGIPVAAIELGVQSMDDGVLAKAGRGHTACDTERAVYLIRKRGRKQGERGRKPGQLGLQMMTGLPGDSGREALETGERITLLAPDFVRIYPTLVLPKSPLADLYENGRYRPQSLSDSVALVKRLYLKFRKRRIPVIRMGLQAQESLSAPSGMLAGPYHPAFGHLIFSALFRDMAEKLLTEDPPTARSPLTIQVHRRSISKMRGQANANIAWLAEKFHLSRIRVTPAPDLSEEMIAIDGNRISWNHL